MSLKAMIILTVVASFLTYIIHLMYSSWTLLIIPLALIHTWIGFYLRQTEGE